jgi:matrixin
VGYSLQKQASRQISLSDARAVAAQAFAAWQTVQCPDVLVNGINTGGGPPAIFVSELEPVDCDEAPSQEHNNPIIFRDDGWPYTDSANAIGYTTLTVDLSTGEILGADIEINTSTYTIVAKGPAPAGSYDLATVLTHEAGHFLGLAHSDHRDAVMFALYQPNTTTITPDDAQGICDIYNSSGARNTAMGAYAATSCNPEPRLGFLDECGSIDSGIVSNGTGPSSQGSSVGSGATTQSTAATGGSTADADAGIGSADAGVSTETLFGCTVSRGVAPGRASRWVFALGLVSLALRRATRAGRRARAMGMFIAVIAAVVCVGADVRASVSVTVTFDDLIQRASAAAVVIPVEQYTTWEEGRIATYTHVRVDRLVVGRLPADLWLRTLGGAVGRIAQLVEGEATFTTGAASLVFVHPHGEGSAQTYGIVEGAQGQFPIETMEGRPRLAASRGLGALLRAPGSSRPARDVLLDRSLEDAVRAIADSWWHLHGANEVR